MKSTSPTPYTSYKEIFEIQKQLADYNKCINSRSSSPKKSRSGSRPKKSESGSPRKFKNSHTIEPYLEKEFQNSIQEVEDPVTNKDLSTLSSILHERSPNEKGFKENSPIHECEYEVTDNYVKKPIIEDSVAHKKIYGQESHIEIHQDINISPDRTKVLEIDYSSSVEVTDSSVSPEKNNPPRISITNWLQSLKEQVQDYSRNNSPEKKENFDDFQNRKSINYLLNREDPKITSEKSSRDNEQGSLTNESNIRKLALSIALRKDKSRDVSRNPSKNNSPKTSISNLTKNKSKDSVLFVKPLRETKSIDENFREIKSIEEDEHETDWKLPNNNLSANTPPLFFQGLHKMSEKINMESPARGRHLKSSPILNKNYDSSDASFGRKTSNREK